MLAKPEVFEFLARSAAPCARLVSEVTENPESHLAVTSLKERARHAGIDVEGDALERALLQAAAADFEPRITSLPIHESVRKLLIDEYRFYTGPSRGTSLETGSYLFVTACKTISLRRFPAGPMDWEVSGFPRSWLLKVSKLDLPRVAWFLAARTGGFRPMFFMHVARRPKNRGLLLEKEVLKAYYRAARSLELQPPIKAILASSWLHDPAAVAENPHLELLSRPYLQEGGIIVNTGPAPADAGFLEHNADRKEQFESGRLQYQLAAALWPRRAAIDWAHRHPELEVAIQ
jgi:hypothetical protein